MPTAQELIDRLLRHLASGAEAGAEVSWAPWILGALLGVLLVALGLFGLRRSRASFALLLSTALGVAVALVLLAVMAEPLRQREVLLLGTTELLVVEDQERGARSGSVRDAPSPWTQPSQAARTRVTELPAEAAAVTTATSLSAFPAGGPPRQTLLVADGPAPEAGGAPRPKSAPPLALAGKRSPRPDRILSLRVTGELPRNPTERVVLELRYKAEFVGPLRLIITEHAAPAARSDQPVVIGEALSQARTEPLVDRPIYVEQAGQAQQLLLSLEPQDAGERWLRVALIPADEGPERPRMHTLHHLQRPVTPRVWHLRPAVAAEAAALPVAAALAAGELEVERLDAEAWLAEPTWPDPEERVVLVLDRLPSAALAQPRILKGLREHLQRGGGLLHLPRSEASDAWREDAEGFLRLLPFRGVEPPPPADPPQELEEEAPEEAPKDERPPEGGDINPDEPTERETREVPTLVLLLVIDSSYSMKGEKLRLAKQAALEAADTLHPEDRVGVIAFNGAPMELVPPSKASDRAFLAGRIGQLKAGGGTEVASALRLAQEVMQAESAAVKHVILLSDGATPKAPFQRIMRELRADGVTLSTVGTGSEFAEDLLSDLAGWGGGRFHPAYDSRNVPRIFVVEASRVIAATGARKRGDPDPEEPAAQPERDEPEAKPEPEPEAQAPAPPEQPPVRPLRLAWPTAYTTELDLESEVLVGMPPELAPRAEAWPALQRSTGEWVFAHVAAGLGRVGAFTLPLASEEAAGLRRWPQLAPLLERNLRWLAGDPERPALMLEAHSDGRSVVVEAIPLEARAAPERPHFSVHDTQGTALPFEHERLEDGRHRLRFEPAGPGFAATLRAAPTPQAALSRPLTRWIGAAGLRPTAEGEAAARAAWREQLGAEPSEATPEALPAAPSGSVRWSESLGGRVAQIAALGVLLLVLLSCLARLLHCLRGARSSAFEA